MPEKSAKTGNTARETESKEVRLSVRALVEFLLRAGNLSEGRGGWADREAMQAGARIHRKIQKSRGAGYLSEVPLSWETGYPGFRLITEGRADGIYEEDGRMVIEEIKGMYADITSLREPVPVHLAQARCYAFMYALEHDRPDMGICMTYVRIETEEIRQFRLTESREELETFFLRLVEEYRPWAEYQVRWEAERNSSLAGLGFPFSYRPGQQKLTADIYRTILREKQVFVQAPTGTGKTVSAVYPAVKALGEGIASRIFYLTAKTITRTAAEETCSILRGKGMRCKCLTFTAKEKICPFENSCDPAECARAEGHFDRINRVLYEALTRTDIWNRETIQQRSEEGRVCPYELQSDLARFADIVIGDYNYVFDPAAKLRQFFGDGRGRTDAVFLIDEAHNLAERGREMFSADLYREELLSLKRELGKPEAGLLKKIRSALGKSARVMLAYRKEAEDCTKYASVPELTVSLMNLAGLLEEYLTVTESGSLREQVLGLYFRISAFLSVSEKLDERYVIYGYPVGKNDFYIKLFCIDPSRGLQEILDKGRSTVFFSATLVPVQYYRSLLSGRGEEDYAIAVPSPFPEENRCCLVARDVSTRYTRRTPEEFRKIALYIDRATSARPGNYIVYFPSYQMLEDVYAAYEGMTDVSEKEILLQERDMSEEEREAYLRAFSSGTEKTRIGFFVMGGIFAEGIDLQGEDLIGAVIVGTGIPQIGAERELLREYYGKDGFAYAYRNPGMNKVLQAAGRVIRTPEDIGWILLLDERFLGREYSACFPPHWTGRKECSLDTVEGDIKSFWKHKLFDKYNT